jgi:hypothetical protein
VEIKLSRDKKEQFSEQKLKPKEDKINVSILGAFLNVKKAILDSK